MSDVLIYLYTNADSSVFMRNNRLLFYFPKFEIIVLFTPENYIEDDTLVENIEQLENLNILDIIIIKSEFIGHRNDTIEYSNFTPISTSMFYLLKELNDYSKEAIELYDYKILYDYYDEYNSVLCDSNYCLRIFINKFFFDDLNLFINLIENQKALNNKLPSFYNDDFISKDTFDTFEISFVNSNTKTRRLGYLKLLAKFLNKTGKLPQKIFLKKFEDFAYEYETELKEHINDKGVIKITKTGISALPYIDIAKDFKFINSINGYFSFGKAFKVYSQLIKSTNTVRELFPINTFMLSILDRLVFLEHILRYDFFYISSILEIIAINGKLNYNKDLKKEGQFYNFLLQRLKEYKSAYDIDRNSLYQISIIEDRILKWEKPKVYLEHILMPRINWLLDLGLLEMDNKINIELTNKGILLFNHIGFWNDTNKGRVVNPKYFVEHYYLNVFNNTYNFNYKKYNFSNSTKIIRYLKESFDLFSTLAPNRVTLSQAVNYVKIKLFIEDNSIAEEYDIHDFIKNNPSIFIYKYQNRYQDGYIQLINN
jgi:hypothetical protein